MISLKTMANEMVSTFIQFKATTIESLKGKRNKIETFIFRFSAALLNFSRERSKGPVRPSTRTPSANNDFTWLRSLQSFIFHHLIMCMHNENAS